MAGRSCVWCWLVTPKEVVLQDQGSSDEPRLSQKLKFADSGRRPEWHWRERWPAAPQDAKKGALHRGLFRFPSCFGGVGGAFCLGRWKNGDSWSILPPAPPAQRFWGILEMKKERSHSPGAEALWCSPTLSAVGRGGSFLPTGLPRVPPQPLACTDLLSFASGFLLKFSLGPVQLSDRTPLPWPLKKLPFVSIYHLPEYSKKNLAQVSSHSSPAAQVVHHRS